MTSFKAHPVGSEGPLALLFETRHLQSTATSNENMASPILMGFAIAVLLFCKLSCCLCEPSRWRLLNASPPNFTLTLRRWRRRRIRGRRLRAMSIIQDGATLEDSVETIKKTAEHAEKRRQSFLSTFHENKVEMQIEEGNLVIGDHTDEEAPVQDNDQNVYGWIKVPSLRLPSEPVLVANECAICLDSLTVGEMVVWSNNEKCRHAFHQDCIIEYLVQLHDSRGSPCPCCRQQFIIETKTNKTAYENEEDT